MTRRTTGFALIALLLPAAVAAAQGWEHKSSCFQAVRWKGDRPIVRYEGTWYELVSVHGQAAAKVIDFCRKQYERRWQKRFVEDLGQVLDEMKAPPAKHVTLVLQPLPKGSRTEVQAPMTYALRAQAKESGDDQPWVNVTRKHGPASKELATLAKRVKPDRHSSGNVLSAVDAAADLDELEGLLEGAYSYLARRKVNYKAALDTIRAGLGKGIERAVFASQLRKFLSLFGDGHCDVDASLGRMGGRLYPPMLFGEEAGRLFAFKGDRSGLFDPAHPFVIGMEDEPVEKWLAAARSVTPLGSDALVRHVTRRNLRYVCFLRQEMDLPYRTFVYVTLGDGKGDNDRKRIPLTGRRELYGTWPRQKSRILDGRIGYLRLERMDGDARFRKALEDTMDTFRETRGLIIDVRGNGGGTRASLRILAAYFMTDKEPPRVANVARYRLPKWEGKESPDGHLEDRWLFPVTWPGWSAAALKVIEAHAAGFKPEWKTPKKGFTAWHYMVLDRRGAERPYVYGEPVVILMDSGCYSATDVFLGAFKGWPGVTLLGTPSGGGSGRAREVVLAASRLRVRIPSMASFQPSGKLYDGNGIQPDDVVEPAMSDAYSDSDRQLDAALKKLR